MKEHIVQHLLPNEAKILVSSWTAFGWPLADHGFLVTQSLRELPPRRVRV